MNNLADRYINPFTDFGFKKLFGTEVNKDLLIDFLNQIIDDYQIKDLNYKQNENLGSAISDRRAIFDLYCESDKGEKFIIEIQKAKHNFFKDRSIFYSTFPIQEQGEKGEWNFDLKAVYTIGILDFTFDDEDKHRVKVVAKLMDINKKSIFYDKLTYIYLQMPNFNKTEEELETQYDKWLFVLKNLQKLQDRPAKLQERVFEKLFKIAEIAKFNRNEHASYRDSVKIYRDMKNTIDTARDEGIEKGREEGIEKGREEGIEKGREEGIEKGREEGRKEGLEQMKIAMAIEMLKDKQSIEMIGKYTGLSLEKIEELRLK